eukprot:1398762-Pleurochrysis_carterae.AAC.1
MHRKKRPFKSTAWPVRLRNWRCYHFGSSGAKSGVHQPRRRVIPTIVVVKPRMPKMWGLRKPENTMRA